MEACSSKPKKTHTTFTSASYRPTTASFRRHCDDETHRTKNDAQEQVGDALVLGIFRPFFADFTASTTVKRGPSYHGRLIAYKNLEKFDKSFQLESGNIRIFYITVFLPHGDEFTHRKPFSSSTGYSFWFQKAT